jgi:hypothetical protein
VARSGPLSWLMGAVACVIVASSCRRAVAPFVEPSWLLAGCQHPSAGTGTITGRLLTDSVNEPPTGDIVAEAADGRVCFDSGFHPDSLYLFQGLAPGTYSIHGGNGFWRIRRVLVRVGPDSVTRLDLTLLPASLVRACREQPECSHLLEPSTGPGAASEQELLLETVLRTAVVFSGYRPGKRAMPDGICLAIDTLGQELDPPAYVVSTVRMRFVGTYPASGCEIAGENLDWHYRLRGASHSTAWLVKLDSLAVTSIHAKAAMSYHVASLWAASWHCEFARSRSGWEVTECVLTSIA